MVQLVKNPPAMRKTWFRSLGWEDPLEKGRLPTPVSGLENPMDCRPWGPEESDTTERLSLSLSKHNDTVNSRQKWQRHQSERQE